MSLTPRTDEIMRLHEDCKHKLATPANEHALRAKVAALEINAERYVWLRAQHWDTSALAVVSDPKRNVRLGTYCPSEELLDAAIDAARARSA